jgi:hypothetical protein
VRRQQKGKAGACEIVTTQVIGISIETSVYLYLRETQFWRLL